MHELVFGVPERPGDPTRPVMAMWRYVKYSKSEFGWSWDIGSYSSIQISLIYA